jgi:hypothetical protein
MLLLSINSFVNAPKVAPIKLSVTHLEESQWHKKARIQKMMQRKAAGKVAARPVQGELAASHFNLLLHPWLVAL